jgi:hypothetical protein
MKNSKLQKINYRQRGFFEIYNLRSIVSRRGIASLPLILLLGAIIIEVSIASVFFLSYLNSSVYGTRMANEALIAAQSGVNDAVLRIILNKNCGDDILCAPLRPDFYTITTSSATVDIMICKGGNADCPELNDSGKRLIIATGKALTRQHKLVATVTVDSATALVTIDSIKDQ